MPFDPALRQIIARFKTSKEWDQQLDLRLLQALWPKLVGSSLAEATSVVGIDGTRVLIQVPDPSWKKQLLSIRAQLLRKMNEPWPHPWITDIGFTYENHPN